MIEPAKEELQASWVVVDRQEPQPVSLAYPTPWTPRAERTMVGGAAAPCPRALRTVGLGLTGPQALGPIGALPRVTRPNLAQMLFMAQAQNVAKPPLMPTIPGTPLDRGYEADDEEDSPLAPIGTARLGDPHEGAVIAGPRSLGCAP